ncbi:MAG: pyridoxamine 5'-phosphate oxidase family protein [Bacteroidota bacterium]
MILSDREITNFNHIEEIINQTQVCHLGMVDGDKPYVLPFNFAYENKTIYLHCAPVGKKLDVLAKNNQVCITFDTDHKISYRNENVACSWGMKFKSAVLFGKAILIEDYDEKIRILNLVMKKYAGRDDFTYNAPAINNVRVFKVEIESITGKQFGYTK